jgi:hypothetical protein
MVFRGRLSRGCEVCRKAGVKCDEIRPHCARCVRLKKTCVGYRQLDDLMLLDETHSTISKSRRQPLQPVSNIGGTFQPGFGAQDLIVWQFYHSSMASLSAADHAYDLHLQLPSMYNRCHEDAVLVLSARAIAHASASQTSTSTAGKLSLERARHYYISALSALSKALQCSADAATDETFYAVLLLCGYETITRGWHRQTGWTAHVKGAALLLAHRTNSPQTGYLAAKFYHFARRKVALYQLQSGIMLISRQKPTNEFVPEDANEEDSLFTLIDRLSALQHSSRSFQSCLIEPLQTQLDELLADVELLNSEFDRWRRQLPSAWDYRVQKRLDDVEPVNMNGGYVLRRIHTYADVRTARLWNLYRLSRIILHFIAIRTRNVQPLGHSNSYCTYKFDSATSDVQCLVDDICASVPFLSGPKDSGLAKKVHQKPLRNYGRSASNSVNHKPGPDGPDGRYSLLWPLYLASSVDTISEAQQKWIHQQMLLLAEPVATKLVDSPSRILAGESEPYIFDCV